MGNKHTTKNPNEPGHGVSGSSEGTGGKCLVRHVSQLAERNSCSHRWQATLQMGIDRSVYNYPAYASLMGASRIRTAAINRSSEGKSSIPWWYSLYITAPKKAQWDVDAQSVPMWAVRKGRSQPTWVNFKVKCYHPYWHEAHHIVPNGELNKAIAACAQGADDDVSIVKEIRRGLLNEGFNLNHHNNMVMLPLDEPVAKTLGLPRHRKTASLRNHATYSANVTTELNKIFHGLKQQLAEHEAPTYSNVKSKIENLAAHLYAQIKKHGKEPETSLDDMDSSLFAPAE